MVLIELVEPNVSRQINPSIYRLPKHYIRANCRGTGVFRPSVCNEFFGDYCWGGGLPLWF